MNKPIPYGRQNITEEDISAVVEVLKSDFLTQGPKILEFEQKFANYVGSKYAVAVSNGTTALHLSVLALGLKPKQKIITTPITFAASANSALYVGAEVEFADIDPDTALIDLKKVRKLLESSPKGSYSGLIPVDLAGCPVNMEEARKIADEFGLWILEDACHAPGGYFTNVAGEKSFCGNGRYADASVFSFHPVKHIACGEGGMITTNSAEVYEELLLLRTHGITKDSNRFRLSSEEIAQGGWYYEMQELGYNYRIPDILAALGVSQLNRANEGLARRREIAEKYDLAFSNQPQIKPLTTFKDYPGHAYHLYIIQTKDRKELYEKLKANSIYSQVHYIPLHLQPYYKSLGFKKGDFPLAEKYYEEALSIPMYPSLSDSEQDFVIQSILKD
ncbi:UDP-4-amino-4,6-dideoxy-N-acetyl-beta-L-altrosami ne transaminase [Leptospira kobayashii]|uniref:UDP-4-amino-4, 6-dideoxy-N-acetyl-beta-L-altrosami ne transaminase n=1 Tax=Leptospira kobayashii TaxID=1917830 RepID=A0ABM7UK60_9LEPT|nr:UDP-4-amino-4,6-dideoxy-N-acetyl-beta-L-altrosamine transaminase [Leptospira kobayashii]BDA79207.1 UDP-4-amino-4,6-dideoxy-N-acetyl-beta-L-altrosami ne transaminase [Leptospira kobayashii]